MTVPLTERSDGIGIPLRVKPRAKKTRVVRNDTVLLVEVTSPPLKGKANVAVVAALAKALGVKKRQLSIVVGELGRDKVVCVSEVSRGELREAIAALPER